VWGGSDAASDILPAVSHGDACISVREGEAVSKMHVHAPISIRVYLSGRPAGGHQPEQ
jgi:hypothetical protein